MAQSTGLIEPVSITEVKSDFVMADNRVHDYWRDDHAKITQARQEIEGLHSRLQSAVDCGNIWEYDPQYRESWETKEDMVEEANNLLLNMSVTIDLFKAMEAEHTAREQAEAETAACLEACNGDYESCYQ